MLFLVPDLVQNILTKEYEDRIAINKLKTVFSSKGNNRHVTGVTLTNDNKLSIGRDRKRTISALIHKYKIGILSEDDKLHLKGLLAFSMSVEPEFYHRMASKYSYNVV